jgi:rfaE bifunctional protein nucleotidyltransferase chain/domain
MLPMSVPGKVRTLEELKKLVTDAKKTGKTVVFTNGCFDLLHRGHVHVLREAKARGHILIVAVNSDRSVSAIKGTGRPVMPETDRLELITAMEMVDYALLFDAPDPYTIIAALRPDVLVKGGDWSPQEIVGADLVRADGGKVASIPYLKGFSTTEIIEKIRS